MKRTSICNVLLIGLFSFLTACSPLTKQEPHVGSNTPASTQNLHASATFTPTPVIENVQEIIDRCPTAAEVAGIDADLKLTFEYDPTASTLICHSADGSADLSPLQLRTYQVLLVMKSLQFSKPLPWTDYPIYTWFISAVDGVNFGDFENNSCCNPTGIMNLRSNNSMAITTDRWMREDWYGAGIQGLMTLMIHEARHSGGILHSCEGGADYSINELGSWGVVYYTHVWLANYSDPAFMTPGGALSDLYRELNRDMAVAMKEINPNGPNGGYAFCGEPTRTPGPTPTIPFSSIIKSTPRVFLASEQPIKVQNYSITITYKGYINVGWNPINLPSNRAMQFIITEENGKQDEFFYGDVLISDSQGKWINTSFPMGKTKSGGVILNIFTNKPTGGYFLRFLTGEMIDLSPLIK
jgi:hypothetical protein